MLEREFHEKFVLKEWRCVLKYAAAYKKQIYMILGIMVLSGIFDALTPLFGKYAIDNFMQTRQLSGIFGYILLYSLALIVNGALVYGIMMTGSILNIRYIYALRNACYEKLQKLSVSYFDKTNEGFLLARLFTDIRSIGDFFAWGLIDIAWSFFLMFFSFIVMLLIHHKLALLCLAVIPVILIIVRYYNKVVLNLQRKVRQTNSSITDGFNEGLFGANTTKTLAIEDRKIEKFNALTLQMKEYSVKSAVKTALFIPTLTLLGTMGTVFVIWVGGDDLLRGTVSYGTFAVFITYTLYFFQPIHLAAATFAQLQSTSAAAERICDILNAQDDFVVRKEAQGSPILGNVPNLKGSVELQDVCFYYNPKEMVLEHFNLKIKAGEHIAVVGRTGAGKTTLVNLICGLYQPVSGAIRIDGVDSRELPEKWLNNNLGYVSQTPFLFSGTIKENICYGREDADNADMIAAAKLAGIHDFIMALESQYDTVISVGGEGLSVGQKQLISLARAILVNPALYILDEATSAVDSQTEAVIQQALDKAAKGKTVIVIAHRLSTMKNAERILLIDNGKIIEEGSHRQLIWKKGRYYQMYLDQFQTEKVGKALEATR